MPRQARVVLPGLPYHVTQRGVNRQEVFLQHSDHETYLNLVEQNLEDSGTRVLAYCLMPNHVHWILIPDSEDSLAILFRRVHGRYAQYLNTRTNRTGHLWQARYFSCPLSFSHLITALQYVERNPVRAQLTKDPSSYPYSSAAAHTQGPDFTNRKILDMNFHADFGGIPAWRDLIGVPSDPKAEKLLRRCTYSGAPFGDSAFLEEIQSQTGRQWQPRGRPPKK